MYLNFKIPLVETDKQMLYNVITVIIINVIKLKLKIIFNIM